ncbi:hypothetical protein K1719_003613 [Acacia pycnantha]|nr:hypothetical protein K1719_003613 [Acacia pycnantha]
MRRSKALSHLRTATTSSSNPNPNPNSFPIAQTEAPAVNGSIICVESEAINVENEEGPSKKDEDHKEPERLGPSLKKPEVKIESLKGKRVGLYFSASWCPPCRRFTPTLKEMYNKEVSSKGDFEIVYVSADNADNGFKGYFSKMPWLAIPFPTHQIV